MKRTQKNYTEFTYEMEIIEVDNDIANKLAKEFNIDISSSRYHVDGTWYNLPLSYPIALFDLYGYIVIESEHELRCKAVVTKKVHISSGIHRLVGYKKFKHTPKTMENYEELVREEKQKRENRISKFSSLNDIMKNAIKNANTSSLQEVKYL